MKLTCIYIYIYMQLVKFIWVKMSHKQLILIQSDKQVKGIRSQTRTWPIYETVWHDYGMDAIVTKPKSCKFALLLKLCCCLMSNLLFYIAWCSFYFDSLLRYLKIYAKQGAKHLISFLETFLSLNLVTVTCYWITFPFIE